MKEKEENDLGRMNQLFQITRRSGWMWRESLISAVVPRPSNRMVSATLNHRNSSRSLSGSTGDFPLSPDPLVPMSLKESDKGSISAFVPRPSSLVPRPSSLVPRPSSLVPRPPSLVPRPFFKSLNK
jgi:hypothetical protein